VALRDHHRCAAELLARRLADMLPGEAEVVAAGVNDPGDAGEAHLLGIGQQSVVHDGPGLDHEGHPLGAESLDEEPVEHDLPGIVRQVEDRLRTRRRGPEALELLDVEAPLELLDNVLGEVVLLGDREVDDVAGHSQQQCIAQRVLRCRHSARQLRVELQRRLIRESLGLAVRVMHAGELPARLERHLRVLPGGLIERHADVSAHDLIEDLALEPGIGGALHHGVVRLREHAMDACIGGFHGHGPIGDRMRGNRPGV